MPPSLLSLLAAILTGPLAVHAKPYPRDLTFLDLFGRSTCANPCGWSGQLCCAADQACYTDASNQAQCSSTVLAAVVTTNANGYWQYYTKTYTATNLVLTTSVGSSYIAAATTVNPAVVTTAAASSASCNYALNESPCGPICCASGQYCLVSGQCAIAAAGSSNYAATYTTPGASAALRPTSQTTVVVVGATVSATTTVPFVAPVATGANITLTQGQASTAGGLSGGAIAGIVIGVLLGLLLLSLICFYCCIRGLLDGVLALFGLGKNRRRTVEREEYINERHSRYGSGGGGGGGGAGRT
ncbi:hypothetical protein LTR66_016893, partial [Elasticomyces elasticus]